MSTSTGGSTVTPASPATARRTAAARIAVLVGAVAIGLGLNALLQVHLASLQTLANTDPLQARARLATEIQIGGVALFALTCALGASVIAASRRAARDLRFPPAGLWGWGATRTVTGPLARRAAYVGMILGALLMLCSLAGGALSWQIGMRLLTCRAGIASSGDDAPASVP